MDGQARKRLLGRVLVNVGRQTLGFQLKNVSLFKVLARTGDEVVCSQGPVCSPAFSRTDFQQSLIIMSPSAQT